MAARQAPLSLGFSRQEHWSGLSFPLQCMKVKSESEVAQSCLSLRDPMDCSLPGSSVHEIFQARVLQWGAIAFSTKKIYRWLITTWKDVRHHSLLGKWKSKLKWGRPHTNQNVIFKKSINSKCWRGCGEKGSLLHCCWECKSIQPPWRTVWSCLKN